ncbi:hypothetical protein PVK06_009647 [Gossypium arboreum]|uniref:CCHC-type domain-containing protein n=1 Tax=Gossypium arboreum TaxID=29729 RepID=A0ABR0QN64_GOSAR|nr:hypothetical protein PVK06_009647 [Gossypium arboreum]
MGAQESRWLPFKYESLPNFCFGCGNLGHGIKECNVTKNEVREIAEDQLPYSLVLKVESNLLRKETMQMGIVSSDRVVATMGNTAIASTLAEKEGAEAYSRGKWFMRMDLFSMAGGSADYFEKLLENHIDVIVEVEGEKGEWCFTGFYGLYFASNRRDSWEVLRRLGYRYE